MLTGETYRGKPRPRLGPFVLEVLWALLNPAYSIDSSDMRPVTKITIFGIRLAIVVLGLFWLTMFIGTHLPVTTGINDIGPPVNDKVKHFSAFFVLGGLLCYVTNSPRWFRRFMTIGLAGMAYAAIDEWTQRFVPGRFPDVADFAADSIGLWTAIGVYVTAKLIYESWTRQSTKA